MSHESDQAAVDEVVRTFLEAFTTGPGCAERLDALPDLFLPGAVVVRTCGSEPEALDVAGFVEPRRALLLGGTLTEFSEWEVSGRTDLFGDMAQHWSRYAKSGVRDGVPETGGGMKSVQLVRTDAGWRIVSVVWDDDRD